MTKTKLGVGGTKKKPAPPAEHRFHWTDAEVDAFIELACRVGMRVLLNPGFVQALQVLRSLETLR